LSFASSSGTGWIFLSLGSVVSATNPDVIASGDSSWFTISVVIGAAALPSVTNSAWASVPGDPNRFNDRGSDSAPVTGVGELVVQKTAAPSQVEIGDVVDYAVTVKNLGTGPVSGVTVSDALPQGLRCQGGTARRDGASIGEPAGSPGPSLVFALGAIPPGSTAVLTYRVGVGAGAEL